MAKSVSSHMLNCKVKISVLGVYQTIEDNSNNFNEVYFKLQSTLLANYICPVYVSLDFFIKVVTN